MHTIYSASSTELLWLYISKRKLQPNITSCAQSIGSQRSMGEFGQTWYSPFGLQELELQSSIW